MRGAAAHRATKDLDAPNAIQAHPLHPRPHPSAPLFLSAPLRPLRLCVVFWFCFHVFEERAFSPTFIQRLRQTNVVADCRHAQQEGNHDSGNCRPRRRRSPQQQ